MKAKLSYQNIKTTSRQINILQDVKTAVVYIWGYWVSYFPRFSLIFPHFFLKLKSRTTFQILLNILNNTVISYNSFIIT